MTALPSRDDLIRSYVDVLRRLAAEPADASGGNRPTPAGGFVPRDRSPECQASFELKNSRPIAQTARATARNTSAGKIHSIVGSCDAELTAQIIGFPSRNCTSIRNGGIV